MEGESRGADDEDEVSNEERALFAETKNAKSTMAGRTSDLPGAGPITFDELNFDGLRASTTGKRKVDNTMKERHHATNSRRNLKKRKPAFYPLSLTCVTGTRA